MFDQFEVYEEVEDVGQRTLATNWVLTEKIKDGEMTRLCGVVRSFMNFKKQINPLEHDGT